MDDTNHTKHPIAVAIAASCTIVFVTAITIFGELFPGLKNGLKNTFSHHWLGKSILSAAIFLLIYAFLATAGKRLENRSLATFVRLLSWLTILGALAIYGFFIYETLK